MAEQGRVGQGQPVQVTVQQGREGSGKAGRASTGRHVRVWWSREGRGGQRKAGQGRVGQCKVGQSMVRQGRVWRKGRREGGKKAVFGGIVLVANLHRWPGAE